MSDLHERFDAWLTDGVRVELPRDAALHASACDSCLRDAAAYDALLSIDPGAAALPPLRSTQSGRPMPRLAVLRAAVGVAAVVLLAVSVGIGSGGLLDRRGEAGSTIASPTPEGEGILAGAGGPSTSPLPSPSDPAGSGGPSASPEGSEAEASDGGPAPTSQTGAATPAPFVTPGPTAITPPIGTPRPSASAAATPAPTAGPSVPPSFTPTPAPTPTPPTPAPTPTPTPEPTPQCSDGVDNDGDGLIDFGLDPLVNDPDCLSPDDDEAGILP